MNLPFIIVSVLALALGTLSVVLSLLVGRRYHQINRENSDTLREFRSDLSRLAQQVRRESDRQSMIGERLTRLDDSTGGFWRTALGTTLQIRQMSDAHIANALAHLTETGREGSDGWDSLRAEQKRRARDRRLSQVPVFAMTHGEVDGVEFKGLEQIGACMGTENPDASPVDKAIARLVKSVNTGEGFQDAVQALRKLFERHAVPAPDWTEVDKIVRSVTERLGLSNLKHDMHRLAHLLARGRRA